MVKGNFWCSDCDCDKKFVKGKRDFVAEVKNEDSNEKVHCPNNPELELKMMGIASISIATHERIRGKGRKKSEKAARRKESWHNDTAPSIGLDKHERAHFGKKFGKPK